jgi:CheY-like chemotaxis protein
MSPTRILLGEDNAADVYLIRQALKEHDLVCTLSVASNGAEVMDALKKMDSAEELPDLVILDLNLPRHDGLEILSFIRKNPSLAHLTVAILTSSDSPTDTKAATDLGADRYIRKPSNLDSFMQIGAIVRSLLISRHTNPFYSQTS